MKEKVNLDNKCTSMYHCESSQSCRDTPACFRILAIRLLLISSPRWELGMMMDISPLAMTSCLEPG